MKTVWKNIIGACALVAVTTLVTTRVVSQDHDASGAADHDKMMQEWMKYAQPGPEHAQLAKMAGKWSQTSKHWQYPGADPTTAEGMATYESILGGRFLIERTKSKMEMMGQMHDFEGFGLLGFDNMKQKHFFVWADNFGTMVMTGEGEETAPNEITYMSQLPDPMTGGTMKFKCINKKINDDESVFEMFQKQPDGSWFMNMKLMSMRKK